MIMNAFITGSRRYGTPRPNSDLDMVVRMSVEELDALVDLKSVGVSKVKSAPQEGPMMYVPIAIPGITKIPCDGFCNPVCEHCGPF